MRQYQPIWNQIREQHTATLIVPSYLHKRVIQAVRAEKCRDLAYKLLLSEKSVTYKLYEDIDTEKNTITFTLIKTSDIGIEDL